MIIAKLSTSLRKTHFYGLRRWLAAAALFQVGSTSTLHVSFDTEIQWARPSYEIYVPSTNPPPGRPGDKDKVWKLRLVSGRLSDGQWLLQCNDAEGITYCWTGQGGTEDYADVNRCSNALDCEKKKECDQATLSQPGQDHCPKDRCPTKRTGRKRQKAYSIVSPHCQCGKDWKSWSRLNTQSASWTKRQPLEPSYEFKPPGSPWDFTIPFKLIGDPYWAEGEDSRLYFSAKYDITHWTLTASQGYMSNELTLEEYENDSTLKTRWTKPTKADPWKELKDR